MPGSDRPKPPEDLDDNPEWGDADFAPARRAAPGEPADPVAYARLTLRHLADDLERARDGDRPRIDAALPHLREALDALDAPAD